MSFETYEESRYNGQPVDLYYFRYGEAASAYYAYTDHEDPITLGDVVYLPIAIKRGTFQSSGTMDKTTLRINLPMRSDVAELFRIYPPSSVVTLIIRQGHANDPDMDFPVIWSGRVINCERGKTEATISGEPINTSMRRAGLRRHWQYGCPHVLYQQGDGLCNANKAAATEQATITALTGSSVSFNTGWNSRDLDHYATGMIEWDGASGREYRTILRVVNEGTTLMLAGPTRGLQVGDTVDVVLGCPHNMEGCAAIHNNILNYGGQPWIPTQNPINKNPFN